MKTSAYRYLLLTALLPFVGMGTAPAESGLSVRIGLQAPPPDREDYHRWESPHASAVWIPGHHEWMEGRYVWVGGYYAYPPHRRDRWVAARYPHDREGYSYRPGHWSR